MAVQSWRSKWREALRHAPAELVAQETRTTLPEVQDDMALYGVEYVSTRG
jgi:hypothetical protein